MLKDRYPSDEWLQNYHGALAVLLAEKDTVVPSELGQKLYDGYGGRKKLWLEPSATHNDVNQPRAEIYRDVVNFWKRSLKPTTPTITLLLCSGAAGSNYDGETYHQPPSRAKPPRRRRIKIKAGTSRARVAGQDLRTAPALLNPAC
jgi:hypothetical protein